MRFSHILRVLRLNVSPYSPFKYGIKVPTNEEVSRVSDGILDDLTILVGQDPYGRGNEVRMLLGDLVSRAPSELVSDLAFMEHPYPEDSVVGEMLSNVSIRPHQLVLTREERQRISRAGADVSGQLMPDPLQCLAEVAGADDATPVFDAGESLFEELEFTSQTPQRDFVQPERVEPEGCEGRDEEGFMPRPAKRRRVGDSPPVVNPRLEPFLLSPDNPHRTIPIPMTATTPTQVQLLNDANFPQPLPASQNSYVPSTANSRPRDPVQPNPPDTVHRSVRSVEGQGIESHFSPATGRRLDFDEFLALRRVRIDEAMVVETTEAVIDNLAAVEAPPVPKPTAMEVPPDLIDGHTIQVPATDSFPVSRHQYLASLDLLQKHALCRCLSDDSAAIDLVEREFLGGADLILDQDTAILFLPLSTLPLECEGLIAGICNISWRFSHILVIFEAFLISQAFGDYEGNRLISLTFTESISKSVKKLKRSLLIADGVGTKTEDCVVSWAFAENIEEAARLARVYGDMAESRDPTGGLLWQERWWLGERESEDSPLSEFEVRPASLPPPSKLPLPH